MIPQLVQIAGARDLLLPPGIHWATLPEIRARFATNAGRTALFDGIERVAAALELAGCTEMYLDGSYVTSKVDPSDFDGCWNPAGVNAANLDPVLLDFTNKRAAQKQKFGGEMFIATMMGGPGQTFLEFFQNDKDTGQRKGILGVHLPITSKGP